MTRDRPDSQGEGHAILRQFYGHMTEVRAELGAKSAKFNDKIRIYLFSYGLLFEFYH